MGKQHKEHDVAANEAAKPADPAVPITQENVDQAIESGIAAGELPPQSVEQRAGQGLCGHAVRMLVGGHMTTVLLTDFDLSSNSYHGIAIRSFSMDSSERAPVIEAVHGARPYPTTDRPAYAFQFVYPGNDEAVLINIAHNNIRKP